MFDKKAYRERRNKGLRGQEDFTPAPEIAKWTEEDFKKGKCEKEDVGTGRISGVSMEFGRGGMVAVTRRMKRQKSVSRHYLPDRKVTKIVDGKPTTKTITDETGKKHTQKGFHRPVKKFEHPKPLYDPAISNHERMKIREFERAR